MVDAWMRGFPFKIRLHGLQQALLALLGQRFLLLLPFCVDTLALLLQDALIFSTARGFLLFSLCPICALDFVDYRLRFSSPETTLDVGFDLPRRFPEGSLLGESRPRPTEFE